MRIGYVRAKEIYQINEQVNKLISQGVETVFIEDDDTLDRLFNEILVPADALYVTSLDRFSRDIKKTAQILETLYRYGLELYVDDAKYDLEAFVKGSELIDQLVKMKEAGS